MKTIIAIPIPSYACTSLVRTMRKARKGFWHKERVLFIPLVFCVHPDQNDSTARAIKRFNAAVSAIAGISYPVFPVGIKGLVEEPARQGRIKISAHAMNLTEYDDIENLQEIAVEKLAAAGLTTSLERINPRCVVLGGTATHHTNDAARGFISHHSPYIESQFDVEGLVVLQPIKGKALRSKTVNLVVEN